MRWAVFACALAAIIPFSQWLRSNPSQASKIWILFGLLPFAFNPHISLIDWAGWPGFALVCSYGARSTRACHFDYAPAYASFCSDLHWLWGFTFSRWFFQFSMHWFPWRQYSMLGNSRAYFSFMWLLRRRARMTSPDSILTGMVIGCAIEAALTIWQRFGLGSFKRRIFWRSKSLGLSVRVCDFSTFRFANGWETRMAIDRGSDSRDHSRGANYIAGAIGFAIIGLVLVFVVSSLVDGRPQSINPICRRNRAALMAPIAIYSFEARFATSPYSEYDERVVFENAAAQILSDHPMGVGANNYVVAGNTGGYLTGPGYLGEEIKEMRSCTMSIGSPPPKLGISAHWRSPCCFVLSRRPFGAAGKIRKIPAVIYCSALE